tara:strand:- start:124 stop:810 length:687 start_codon:yes stop_codon:yes gene_type:complete
MANSKNEKKIKNRLLVWFGGSFGPALLRFFYNTNKWEYIDRHYFKDALSSGRPIIVASWHNTLLTVFMGLSKKNYFGLAGNHHPDAEIISRIGAKLGWRVVRGSSTDGGKKAYNEILEILKSKDAVFAITPDGPQGPAKIPKPGAIRAAQRSGAIIVPVAGQSSRRWSFKNWDTFYLSKPFGTITLTFGKPLSFSKESSFEECSSTLKQSLDQLEEKVNKHVGLVADS